MLSVVRCYSIHYRSRSGVNTNPTPRNPTKHTSQGKTHHHLPLQSHTFTFTVKVLRPQCSPSLNSTHGGAHFPTKPDLVRIPNSTQTYQTPGTPQHPNLREELAFASPLNDSTMTSACLHFQGATVLTLIKVNPRGRSPRHPAR